LENIKGVLFFDLDGTLLNEHSKLSPQVKDALVDVQKNGYLPVIATGRSVAEMQVDAVLETSEIRDVIMMNGMEIMIDGKKIYQKNFPTKDIVDLLAFAKENQHELGFYTDKQLYVSDQSEDVTGHYTYFHQEIPAVDDKIFYDEDVSMLLLLSHENELDSEYQNRFPQMNFFRNSPYSVDVTIKGIDKGTGIREFLRLNHLEDVKTYAFGDGANDLAMFRVTDEKIAMGNAIEALKNEATFIADRNTQDGVISAFKYFKMME
jgi:Cof subfamily protein (haloacid dehalogenase superfamily)